jgi:hypothetical protein
MKRKIKVGDIIRVINGNFNRSGVVIKINDFTKNEYLKYVDIDCFDPKANDEIRVCSHSPYYIDGDFSVIFLGETDRDHFESIKKKYKEMTEVPKIEPNRNYLKNNKIAFEVYVKTKKDWFGLIKTTAKMAAFEGGRCKIGNITDMRMKNGI